MTTSTNKKPLEKEIQREILDYLHDQQIFYYRNNSGSFAGQNQFGQKRFVQFGVAGMPDIVAIISGKYTGIEVKRPGCKQSEMQSSFQKRLEHAGGRYILAYSLSGCVSQLLN
jgi:hypothetical protein